MNAEASNDSEPRAFVVEERGHVSIIRLNRPAVRNSLSVATLEELEQVVSAFLPRTSINTIIFTGTETVFASGANIRELQKLAPATAKEFARRGQHLFQKIADARQLTIAAINGYCMGGGLDLALACQLRCASTNAVLAHPGARLGIITGWGGTQRLSRLIGSARALEMFATARRVTAHEAFEMNLVNRVSDDALTAALEIASSHHQSSS